MFGYRWVLRLPNLGFLICKQVIWSQHKGSRIPHVLVIWSRLSVLRQHKAIFVSTGLESARTPQSPRAGVRPWISGHLSGHGGVLCEWMKSLGPQEIQ
jgi:hypothetical protein